VLRAMGKIVQPIFPWSETVTLVALVTVVTVYASVGGIRGVIFTDLVQFVLGLFGSFWLAAAAWNRVGGRAGLRQGLDELYGADALQLTALFPDFANGWAAALGLGAFSFGDAPLLLRQVPGFARGQRAASHALRDAGFLRSLALRDAGCLGRGYAQSQYRRAGRCYEPSSHSHLRFSFRCAMRSCLAPAGLPCTC
jgi:Na+/proline symporter